MRNLCQVMVVLFLPTIFFAQHTSFETDPVTHDTINVIDHNGLKQGKWIVYGKSKANSCFQPDAKAEEGVYSDNKKNGIWKEYYCTGNMKNKITFNNGRPDGYAIIYHENGKISEEGTWKINKWVGNYKLYYDNGQVQQEFNYNTSGRREGPQKYYYDNGQVMIEGDWNGGKETGVIKEYHENGDLKAEKTYNDGSVDLASIKTFEPKKPLPPPEVVADKSKKVHAKKEETLQDPKQKAPTMLNGHYILYNKNKQKTKDGTFKDNRLMEGKNYIYNENGILTRIEVYKDGAYVGDAQIEN